MATSKTSYAEIIKKEYVEENKIEEEIYRGEDHKLSSKWVLWCHTLEDRNWNVDSYKKLFTISTISDFWSVFNNLEAIGVNVAHLFLMREGINPTWEDPANRAGGVCSFKVEMKDSEKIILDIAVYLALEKLSDNKNDINGLSISPKNNWGIIKIWNRDKKNDLTVTLNDDILTKYQGLSIKYSIINPED
ncbi:MAG: hypothetical protein CMF62_03135 [Magnetococcales bacterium]|nr:hypothetical protein [Magnetococcales bacterium]|tara:strand:+ start:35044 stop:35613 length:570 start_codon:yes stop_codon:yes gene_type:complete